MFAKHNAFGLLDEYIIYAARLQASQIGGFAVNFNEIVKNFAPGVENGKLHTSIPQERISGSGKMKDNTMQYMALIYAVPNGEEGYEGDMMADYGQFTQDAIAAGVYVGGEALMPETDASTVRMRDGKAQIIDGPFAETKEVLGGYYLLECADLDEALSWGAKIPSAKYGCVEVRPVMVFDQ